MYSLGSIKFLDSEKNNFPKCYYAMSLKGGRGHASLVIKCKLCSRENSIGNIVTLYFI
jgi:hypothetical protein